jgi:hypothetical protein
MLPQKTASIRIEAVLLYTPQRYFEGVDAEKNSLSARQKKAPNLSFSISVRDQDSLGWGLTIARQGLPIPHGLLSSIARYALAFFVFSDSFLFKFSYSFSS